MDATIDQALPEANYVQAEYPPFTDYMVTLDGIHANPGYLHNLYLDKLYNALEEESKGGEIQLQFRERVEIFKRVYIRDCNKNPELYHPYVVEFLDVGADEGAYKYIMYDNLSTILNSPIRGISYVYKRLLTWMNTARTGCWGYNSHVLSAKAFDEFNKIRDDLFIYNRHLISSSFEEDAVYVMLSVAYSSLEYWTNEANMNKWIVYNTVKKPSEGDDSGTSGDDGNTPDPNPDLDSENKDDKNLKRAVDFIKEDISGASIIGGLAIIFGGTPAVVPLIAASACWSAMEPMTCDNTKHIAVWQNIDQIIMYERY